MQYIDALSKVLPVILLLLLGFILNRRQFLQPGTVQEIKKLVINITLPALLFLAFAQASFQANYLIIVGLVFGACVLVLLFGRFIGPLARINSPYFPPLLTGFEAGMIGYAIFSAVYGTENLFKFAIVDLGQVTFVFFVLVPVLERLSTGPRPFASTLISFIRTPVILAILGGILANRVGLVTWLEAQPLASSLVITLEIIAGLTTPLVAVVIGYEMRLERNRLSQPALTVAIRLACWLPLGVLIATVIIGQLLALDPVFQAALLTLFILPPPFVIPLFIPQASEEQRTYVVNTLSLATLVTLLAFAIVGGLFPA
jgi:malate permease and related proteins